MKNFFSIALAFVLLISCKDESEIPTSIKLTRVRIAEYPITTPDGDAWDSPDFGFTSGPDVHWEFTYPQLFSSPIYEPNADGDTLTYTSGLPIYLEDPEAYHSFEIIDLDDIDASDSDGNDDQMDVFDFRLWSSGQTGTRTIEINHNGYIVLFDVEVIE